jgi:hypothetical protein
MFEFYPNEYLLFPLVDASLRITYCDNSIWNLDDQASADYAEWTEAEKEAV